MELEKIRELMQKGTRIEMGTELLNAFGKYALEALQITMEMNNHYHTPEQIRELFARLTGSKIDESCMFLPPFYTEFGKKYKTWKACFYQ